MLQVLRVAIVAKPMFYRLKKGWFQLPYMPEYSGNKRALSDRKR